MRGLSAWERETVVSMNDKEGLANIWTAQRPVITRLMKNPAATLEEEGTVGTTAWAVFSIPRELISFRAVSRKKSS